MTYYFVDFVESHEGSLSIKRIKDGKWALFTIHTAPCLSISTLSTAISINLYSNHYAHTQPCKHTRACTPWCVVSLEWLLVFPQGTRHIEAHYIRVLIMFAPSKPFVHWKRVTLWRCEQNMVDKSKEASGHWEALKLVWVVTDAACGSSKNPNMFRQKYVKQAGGEALRKHAE